MACTVGVDSPIILGEEVIIDCIKNFINVEFTTAELRQPSPEKLRSIFGAFVCSMLEISNEQITQLPLHIMETINRPELHLEEGAQSIIFIKAVTYFMDKCGIQDFSFNDILNPTRKRTRKLLSAIVNYKLFTSNYNVHQRKITVSKIENIKEEQKQFNKKKEELPAKIANLKSKRLERQKTIQELNLNKMNARLQELESLKKERMIDNAKAKANVDELKNLRTVVHSSRLIHEGKEAVDVCKARVNVTVMKEELVKQHEEVTPSALRLVQDIEKESINCQVLINDMEKVKDHSLELSQKDKAISSEIQNVDLMINAKEDKKERTKARHSEMKKLVNEREVKLSNKMVMVQEDVKMKEMHTRKVGEEKTQIEELTVLYDKEHKEALRVMSEKFNSLQSKVLQYNDKIFDAYQ